MYFDLPTRRLRHLTWYVVVRGLNASREVGVLWDGVGVVIKQREFRQDIRVSRYQDWGQHCGAESKGSHEPPAQLTDMAMDCGGSGPVTWSLNPLIVVRVDADLILLQVEGILAGLHCSQLMVAVQVRPTPQAAVENVRKALSVGHLQAAIQGPAVTTERKGVK